MVKTIQVCFLLYLKRVISYVSHMLRKCMDQQANVNKKHITITLVCSYTSS